VPRRDRRRPVATFDRLYLQVVDLRDLDHLDFIAREILPKLD
jgi:hypothetical protein